MNPTEQQIAAAKTKADKATQRARAANDACQEAIDAEAHANDQANQARARIEEARKAHWTARSKALFAEQDAAWYAEPRYFEVARTTHAKLDLARFEHENAINAANDWTNAAIQAETAATKARKARTRARHAAAQACEKHEELVRQAGRATPAGIDWTRPIADQGHAAHRTIAADAEAKARARHPGHEPPHHVEADRAHDHPKATTANQPTPALQPPTTASD
jgi:hypothetical protein